MDKQLAKLLDVTGAFLSVPDPIEKGSTRILIKEKHEYVVTWNSGRVHMEYYRGINLDVAIDYLSGGV